MKNEIKIFPELINRIKMTKTLSNAKKRKVGAVIIVDDLFQEYVILSDGWNRSDFNDKCENSENETFEHVIHAEEDAVIKMLKRLNNPDVDNLTMYCTYTPCYQCAKLIVQANIKKLIILEKHPKNFHTPSINGGLSVEEYLTKSGILIHFYNEK